VVPAGRDPARHTSLNDPSCASQLLEALHEVGASDMASKLATTVVGQASPDSPRDIARLLPILLKIGASDAVAALLARAPARHVSLNDPQDVTWLLRALRDVGASDAVAELLARDPARHASLDDPWRVRELLEALQEAGDSDAANTLAAQAANAGMFGLPPDKTSVYTFGREPDGKPTPAWNWQPPPVGADP
jgi:hypothetical protein